MALDVETLDALEELSKKWNISKAEVMRRSICKTFEEEKDKLTPLEALMKLKQGAGISQEVADEWLKEIRETRENWRDAWADYYENHAPRDTQ